jgi:hypothetical protein
LSYIGLKDKIKGARKDLFELEQQARVPDYIKCLNDVKKDTPTILSSLKGRGNGNRDAEALLDSRGEGSETKLVGGDDPLRIGRRHLRRSLILEKRGRRLNDL